MAALAVLAALATARAALAMHTALRSEPFRSAPGQDFMPAGGDLSARAGGDKTIDDMFDTPAAVQANLDERRRELERLEQDTESAAVDAREAGSRKRRGAEQGLWLGGRSRQAMTNYDNVQYVCFMEVGNQTISGILDTGSFELVVFSTVCRTCGQASKYNPDLSANHTMGKLSTVQAYGSGDLFAQEAWDMVSIGPFPPKHQPFWEVTSAKMAVLQYSAFQAIIGVGPPDTPALDADELVQRATENISNYTAAGLPVPDELKKEFELRTAMSVATKTKSTVVDTFGVNMFSICFGKKPGSAGYVIWSDTAPLIRPEYFKRVQVTGDHTWSVKLSEPRFVHGPAARESRYEGKKLGCEHGCAALLDSGTSLIGLPGDTINELVTLSMEPWFDCSHFQDLPSIKVRLGDQEIILPPDVYIADVSEGKVPEYLQSFVRLRRLKVSNQASGPDPSKGKCELMVMESGADTAHGPLWIFGAPFFRQFYTAFEVGGHTGERRAVHIARASDTCTPSAPRDVQEFVPPTQLYRRRINPSKLLVPPSAYSALSADYVHL